MAAKYKWITTKHKGLRFREHPKRKHGIRKDRFYQFRSMINGKRIQESFGWSTEGWTEERCLIEIAHLKQNRVTGIGPQTLQEKRDQAQEKKTEMIRSQMTFSDLWEHYLPQAKADRGEKALVIEESTFRLWIQPVIGNNILAAISPIHLEKLKLRMAKAGKAPRTIHYALAIVRQVFNYAKRNDFFTSDNPVGKIKKPSTDNRRTRFLNHEEAQNLLKELKIRSLQTHDMALLSLYTGMRAGEIFALTWGDIDFDRGIITLRNTKNGHNRPAFMTEQVKNMLLDRQPQQLEPDSLVFPGRGGVKIKQISDTFNRTVTRLGLNKGVSDPRQKVVFHTLRHTFASWLVENGTDLYTVKELLGHSDFKMTSRYAHLGENSLQAAVRSLEGTLNTKNNVVSISKTA